MIDEHADPILPPDEQRPPQLVPGRSGSRLVSLAALIERVVLAFEAEHGATLDDSPSSALSEAITETDRLRLLREVVNHVLAVESVLLPPDAQADLTRRAYSELFGFGPLDELFADDAITTIALEGIERVAVRRGHGELATTELLFEDLGHFRRVIARLLRAAGAELRDDQPIIEAGLTMGGRRVALNIVGPPVAPQLNADLRLHPREPVSLEAFCRDERARAVIAAIARSPHGCIIVGEPESCKTTLLGAMLRACGQIGIVSVERAGELSLPDGAESLTVRWPLGDAPGISFSARMLEALALAPACISLDEVRADETAGLAALLLPETADVSPPRLLWTFRGPAERKRLTAALGMVARRADPERGEALVQALYDRLPFVITLRRRRDAVQVTSIAEWQRPDGAEYPDYVELLSMGWEALQPTGKRPLRALDLPDDVWGQAVS